MLCASRNSSTNFTGTLVQHYLENSSDERIFQVLALLLKILKAKLVCIFTVALVQHSTIFVCARLGTYLHYCSSCPVT